MDTHVLIIKGRSRKITPLWSLFQLTPFPILHELQDVVYFIWYFWRFSKRGFRHFAKGEWKKGLRWKFLKKDHILIYTLNKHVHIYTQKITSIKIFRFPFPIFLPCFFNYLLKFWKFIRGNPLWNTSFLLYKWMK